jgi:peptidoglycan/xylan/chitin deacetylase (PgdA/CDA1 family)
MMPISKRDRLAGLLSAGGLLRILDLVARRPCLLVVNYHRIGSCEQNRFDDGVFSATADAFREQVRYLRANFEIFGQDELLKAASDGFRLKRAAVAISFDDGYRDNHEIAFPILRELGVPAFFFIPTEYVDRPRLPWWDRIAFILKTTSVARLRLDDPHPLELDLRQTETEAAILQFLKFFKTAGRYDEETFFGRLEERAEVAVDPSALGQELFMSWDQIQQLRAAGMGIGSHTHSHRILAYLPKDEQQDELSKSKARLESVLGESVETIAYPVGSTQAFTELTKSLARDVGYRAGFSHYGGINRPGRTDCYDIQRNPVDESETFPLFRARAVLHNLTGKSI